MTDEDVTPRAFPSFFQYRMSPISISFSLCLSLLLKLYDIYGIRQGNSLRGGYRE
jgi:hypothetical protein